MSKCRKCLSDYSGNTCRPCANKKRRERYSLNKSNFLERNKIWSNKNKESVLAKIKEWCIKNPNKVKEYKAKYVKLHKEETILRTKEWQRKNKERLSVHRRNRRARLKNAEGIISTKIVDKLMFNQRGMCIVCRKKLNKYHLDHIMPLALGGSNKDSNMQLLCPSCNLKKSAKHPIDFMQSMGFLI
jgi:5-methylcytosine-specific restriction endonuclease McrA